MNTFNNFMNGNIIQNNNSLKSKIEYCYSIMDNLLKQKTLLDHECFIKNDFSLLKDQVLFPSKMITGNDSKNEYEDIFKFQTQNSYIELPSSDEENDITSHKKKIKPSFKEICDHYYNIRCINDNEDKDSLNYPGILIQDIPKEMNVEDLRKQIKTFFDPVELRIINVKNNKLGFCKFDNIHQCNIFYNEFQKYGQKRYAYDNFDNSGEIYYVIIRNISNYMKSNFEEKYLKNYEKLYMTNEGNKQIEKLGGINCWVIAFINFNSAFKFCKEFNKKDGLKIHFHYKCLRKNKTNINIFKKALFGRKKNSKKKNKNNKK